MTTKKDLRLTHNRDGSDLEPLVSTLSSLVGKSPAAFLDPHMISTTASRTLSQGDSRTPGNWLKSSKSEMQPRRTINYQ